MIVGDCKPVSGHKKARPGRGLAASIGDEGADLKQSRRSRRVDGFGARWRLCTGMRRETRHAGAAKGGQGRAPQQQRAYGTNKRESQRGPRNTSSAADVLRPRSISPAARQIPKTCRSCNRHAPHRRASDSQQCGTFGGHLLPAAAGAGRGGGAAGRAICGGGIGRAMAATGGGLGRAGGAGRATGGGGGAARTIGAAGGLAAAGGGGGLTRAADGGGRRIGGGAAC